MAFTKFTSDVENIQKLADRPQLEPKALKEVFDKAGEDIKKYVAETLVPEMEAVTAAESIGATYLGDGDPHPDTEPEVPAVLLRGIGGKPENRHEHHAGKSAGF